MIPNLESIVFLSLTSDALIIGKAIFIGALIGIVMNLIIHFLLDIFIRGDIYIKGYLKGNGKCALLGGIVGPFAVFIDLAGWDGLALTIVIVGIGSAIWEKINASYLSGIFNVNRVVTNAFFSIFSFGTIKLVGDNAIALTEQEVVAVIQHVSGLVVIWQRLGDGVVLMLSGTLFGRKVNTYTQTILNKFFQAIVKVRDLLIGKK